jgi:hypothetical protein
LARSLTHAFFQGFLLDIAGLHNQRLFLFPRIEIIAINYKFSNCTLVTTCLSIFGPHNHILIVCTDNLFCRSQFQKCSPNSSVLHIQAIDHIINSAAKSNYMSAGQINVPIVFRGPNGAAAGVGAQHSQVCEWNLPLSICVLINILHPVSSVESKVKDVFFFYKKI